jgi:hypothetical protein
MKIKTSAAASDLGITIPHLFQHLAEIGGSLSFEEVWPEIDIDWVKSISQMVVHRPDSSVFRPTELTEGPRVGNSLRSISEVSRKILDKLTRQKKWGHSSVSFEALQNLTHLSGQEISAGLIELRSLDFLDNEHDGVRKGNISLNTAKRKEIESVK